MIFFCKNVSQMLGRQIDGSGSSAAALRGFGRGLIFNLLNIARSSHDNQL